jgi:23S rRNA G2445 N2-methylase RlmL
VLKEFGLQAAAKADAEHLVEIRIKKNQMQASLSMAGGALYKRGYKRSLKAVASMREDLAACATRLTRHWLAAAWGAEVEAPDLIYVPFAGSGTLGFEAEINWRDLAPALWRPRYACEDFACAPAESLAALRKKLQPRAAVIGGAGQLIFVEKNRVQAAALAADVEGFSAALPVDVECITGDVFALTPPASRHVFIPLNPPYGDRLKDGGPALYKKLGGWLSDVAADTAGRLSGYVMIPDDRSRQALQKNLRGLKVSGQAVISGGKTLTLALFRN